MGRKQHKLLSLRPQIRLVLPRREWGEQDDVCICLHSIFGYLVFSASWLVSMHDPQGPADAAVTSDLFGYSKVDVG